MEAPSCCICLKSSPVLYKITEKTNGDETIAPIYKLLICIPDTGWLQDYQICNLCKDNLNETYDFREMCFKSNFLRCEIKIEDHKVEIFDDGYGNDLKIEVKDLDEIAVLPTICNICSKFTENLSRISGESNVSERNVSLLVKLESLIKIIDWSNDSYAICNLCEESLNKAYDFYLLCFKNQCNNGLAIESKQIKTETIDIKDVKIEPNKLTDILENNCTYCEYISDSKQQLIVHLRSEHPTKTKRSNEVKNNLRPKHKCEQCDKEFMLKGMLRRHLVRVHKVAIEPPKHECHLCLKQFTIARSLRKHLSEQHLKMSDYKCEQCGEEFKSLRPWQTHLAKVHDVGVAETLKHVCDLCAKRFVTINELKRHSKQVHLNICDFQCEQCGKEFKRKSTLQRHLASLHEVEVKKPHECNLCSKRFLLKHKLKIHLRRVHLNIYDFKCEHCSKEFKAKETMRNHLAIIHKVGVEETLRYQCDLCSERFVTPSELKMHSNQVHLKIYDFKCELCDKEFKRKLTLKRHLANIHDIGINKTLKHKCHLCSKGFKFLDHLNKHVRLMHLNIYDFICEQCGHKFKQKTHLLSHLTNVHKL